MIPRPNNEVVSLVKDSQKAASYHCGIGELLRTAYQRDFSMLEMGKCKTKFPTFNDWYATLNTDQRKRIDALREKDYTLTETK
jgi:hypothetical protein